MTSKSENLPAAERYRQAFERLKANEPEVLKPGTPVSQNNVAKEAGCDPTALRKSRFSALIREIQVYIEMFPPVRPPSRRQELIKRRKARKTQKSREKEIEDQRDKAQSKLASAIGRIVELSAELKLVKAELERFKPPPRSLR